MRNRIRPKQNNSGHFFDKKLDLTIRSKSDPKSDTTLDPTSDQKSDPKPDPE